MKQNQGARLLMGAWTLGLAVSVTAIIAWGTNYHWKFLPFDAYRTFPVLGLLAFSLMWTHYIIGALRDMQAVDPELMRSYFRYTGYAVLVLVCLHPGLLIYQLFRDGAGLPPGSYEHYVAQGMGWITLVGTASLLVFLSFELHRFFGKQPWWHWVVDASDAAMLAIVYHSLRLGSDLHRQVWFRYVWWFYAVTLFAVLVRKYALRLTNNKPGQLTGPLP
jgi:hypothetical protein